MQEIVLHLEKKQDIKMYLIEGHERYLMNLGAQFQYEIINSPPELEYLHISNPVSLLIDRNGTVHHIHHAETDNVEKSRSHRHEDRCRVLVFVSFNV